MGVTKSNLFTASQNKLAGLAKVLSHPARIAILEQLFNKNNCICNFLVDEIGLAQATISQHLRELKTAGIIKGKVEGTSVCYCIDQEKWSALQSDLNQFFKLSSDSKSCC